MNVGAETVLRKPYRDHELWDAIQRAICRDAELRLEAHQQRESQARFADLTAGETAVLDLIAGGDPNKVAARRLGISLRTVEDRRHKIMKKFGVESFAALMEVVIEARQQKCG